MQRASVPSPRSEGTPRRSAPCFAQGRTPSDERRRHFSQSICNWPRRRRARRRRRCEVCERSGARHRHGDDRQMGPLGKPNPRNAQLHRRGHGSRHRASGDGGARARRRGRGDRRAGFRAGRRRGFGAPARRHRRAEGQRAAPAPRHAPPQHPRAPAQTQGRSVVGGYVRDRHQSDRPARAARTRRQGRHVRRRRRWQDGAGDGANPLHGRKI